MYYEKSHRKEKILLNPRKESESLDLPASVEQNPLFGSKLVPLLFTIEISNDSISPGAASDVILGFLVEGVTNNPYAPHGLISAFLPS